MFLAQGFVYLSLKLNERANFAGADWRSVHFHAKNIGGQQTAAIARAKDFPIPLARWTALPHSR